MKAVKGGHFYEFFAGGGMARAGLGPTWNCLFANDIDKKKAAAYVANWGSREHKTADVASLSLGDLPGRAELSWASFPCQDLSLAGMGAGLNGARSGSFWPFWELMKALQQEGRAPALIVLENVCGALTSHEGKDFAALAGALAAEGYRFGALVIDAVHFLPQSRPRLFIVAAHERIPLPRLLVRETPDPMWSPAALLAAYAKLPRNLEPLWVCWKLSVPPTRATVLSEVVENNPQGVVWHSAAQTNRLLDLMTPLNRRKVEAARRQRRPMFGTIYKRTRANGDGERVQRAEIRFDDISGCLRTPAGGSSRQYVMFVEGASTRSRLLSPREAARLMGLPETYQLPGNYNEAYHLAGDGVAVPVVRHLAVHLLAPLLAAARAEVIEAPWSVTRELG